MAGVRGSRRSKGVTALGIVLELIEGRAGWRQQNRVTGKRSQPGLAYGLVEGATIVDRRRSIEGGGKVGRIGSDQVDLRCDCGHCGP